MLLARLLRPHATYPFQLDQTNVVLDATTLGCVHPSPGVIACITAGVAVAGQSTGLNPAEPVHGPYVVAC